LRLNLGAGSQAEPGWVNHDQFDQPGIDVVWDLDQFPWPFDDDSADEIKAFDVYEHVDEPLGFMCESWRILKPDGLLYIHTTWVDFRESFHDPTHKRFCTETSFDFWVPGTYWNDRYGTAYSQGRDYIRFNKTAFWVDPYMNIELRKIARAT